MLRRTLLVCLVSFLAFSFIPLTMYMESQRDADVLQVRDGVMDLASWTNPHTKSIRLNGDWEFYWNRLLTPEDFKTNEKPVRTAYMKVPGQWNGKRIDGQSFPADGSATYRMTLTHLPVSGSFALKKMNVRFASTIYVNGAKLLEDGKPSGDASSYRAGNAPQIGYFTADRSDVEIIVQVSNYDYVNAGIPVSLYFGDQAVMMQQHQKDVMREFSLFAILATLSLIFFICFATTAIYRRTDFSLLSFAILCLFFALYSGLTGERPLFLYLPGFSFEFLYKLKDISSLTAFIMLTIFFYQLQKNIISLKWTKATTIVLGILVVLIVVLPIRWYVILYSGATIFYQTLLFGLLARVAVLYIRSARADRFKSFLLFMSILSVNLYSIALLLFALSLTENLWLGQFYIFLFNCIIVFLLVLRFFEAYHTINQMKEQLLKLDKIKDDFLSNTSHELRTPLNAIVNITDTLLQGAAGAVNEKQAKNLTIVMDSGRRLTQLVNELLDYSKMKNGDIALHRSVIDLKTVVDSIVRIHSFLLGGKPIELVNNVPEDMPAVHADSNRLVQILHNLVGNAVKFTEKGSVEIGSVVILDKVEIRVRDTGIGIAEDMQQRIFNPFDQVDPVVTKNRNGTGLGLSITKELVELHGGEIKVISTPGNGSEFRFTLPISRFEAASASLEEELKLPHSNATSSDIEYPIYIEGARPESILVVDDDFANLQTMMNLFALEGYSLVVVNRGQLALTELERKRDFFLVILDVRMPDMSGYEVLRAIRARQSSSELPVLMLTANNRAAEIVLSMEGGANDFVGKPFESEELKARVRSLIHLKASVQTARDAEIAFLRSQIKPHFLNNALNSIAALCIYDPAKAEELTLQLSMYLRNSFDFKQLDSFTTLANEMELVQAYIIIEKARFGDRLQVEYDVDADRNARIPPLILQPLVENAIRHGLMSTLEGGTVRIEVKQSEDDTIRFAVEDNGSGMNDKVREEAIGMNDNQRGVGLWNISQRLRLLYGKTIRIESQEGIGTKVYFDIPAFPD
ncbi:ATP-binding protein [Cohnella sp. AR92]|uniref:ATP-binding protein n=1 Tax=Cohnella sp. AR92 TaxID=648716 RepID=UPI0013156489|nr:ATP-binding protein [Cohnella sp. AR92]